jgi:hypothetical protein
LSIMEIPLIGFVGRWSLIETKSEIFSII